ncbi:MAG: crossover junction endodeoxyribonuclease RuvC [Oscillospiraceae bacterium]|nr:crossover junction endodeoxyribonuclease RuvC [Oscillospiraceae bacterium]MBQ8731198.1 crossover junction endodeoxyribonuclease RuvC [Oscillospiraceae bacterium]
MVILGIDPGYATVGYGVVQYDNVRFTPLAYGAITTPASLPFPQRLEMIYRDMTTLLEKFHPDCMAVEKLYFNTNTTTAIDVAQARGIVLLCARLAEVPIFEYTPLQVKMSVTGYGQAEKSQVMEMTRILLRLDKIPRPDDAADALAIAICQGHTGLSRMRG